MILETRGVSKAFGGVVALSDCSLSVKEGLITALIGPNGSGKTTLFNVITRLLAPDAGSVYLHGEPLSGHKAHEVARAGVSRTFQQPRLFDYLTLQDHLEIALLDDDERVRSAFTKTPGLEEECASALECVGLEKPLDTLASSLSYGQEKLLDLAVALAKPHSILLLDEPVAGVNPELRSHIKDVLRTLREEGETVLVIEHDMNFVMDLADEVAVMHQGRILLHDEPGVVREDEEVLEAYLGA